MFFKCCSYFSGTMDVIIKKLTEIHVQTLHLTMLVNRSFNKSGQHGSYKKPDGMKFPVCSLRELGGIEEQLQSKSVMQDLVSFLFKKSSVRYSETGIVRSNKTIHVTVPVCSLLEYY